MGASDPGAHGLPEPDTRSYLKDHRALEAAFADLLGVLEAGQQDQVAPIWASAVEAFSEDLRKEERTTLAYLLVVRPGDARALLHEHAHMRGRMTQLRNTLPTVSTSDVQLFLSELRAHDRHEEEVLGRWAESTGAAPREWGR